MNYSNKPKVSTKKEIILTPELIAKRAKNKYFDNLRKIRKANRAVKSAVVAKVA